MKADPTKNSLTGAKKKKKRNDSVIGSVGHAAANVGRAGLGTFNKAGNLAKSFNEAVLPINEVKRIAKGKGSKGDYAYTALSALPLIGRTGKVAGAASKMATRGTRVSKPYATKVTSAISKSSKPIGKSGKASTSTARSAKTSSQIKKVVVNDTNRTMRASELKQLKAAFNQRNSTSKAFGKYSEVDAKRAFNVSDRQIAAVRKNRGSLTSPQRMKTLRREGVELQRQGGTYPADRPKPSIPQRQAKVTKRRQTQAERRHGQIVAAQKYSNAYKRLQK